MDMSEIDLTLGRRPLRGELRLNQAMKKYTSWRAGGQAERLYIPADLADFAEFLRGVPPDEPIYVIGPGRKRRGILNAAPSRDGSNNPHFRHQFDAGLLFYFVA